MTRLVLLAPLLAAAGCATVPAGEPPVAVMGEGRCSNDDLAHFTGQPASQQLGADILRASGATVLQWINPGEAVTMDFRDDRVRVTLDANRRVEGARCG